MRGHGIGWNPCQANFKIKVLHVYKPIQIDSKQLVTSFIVFQKYYCPEKMIHFTVTW